MGEQTEFLANKSQALDLGRVEDLVCGMRLFLLLGWFFWVPLFGMEVLMAQGPGSKKKTIPQEDSVLYWHQVLADPLADQTAESADQTLFVPAQLQAGKDLFNRLTGFRWGLRRFRVRSIPHSFNRVYLNGIPLFLWYAGHPGFSRWTGLQAFMPRAEQSDQMASSVFLPGGTGQWMALETTAKKVRPQQQLHWQLTNRAGPFRLGWSGTFPFQDTAWSFAWGVQVRGGALPSRPDLWEQRLAYFMAVGYQKNGHYWGMSVLGNAFAQNRPPAMTQAFFLLSPAAPKSLGWGMQAGKIRRSHVQVEHMPIFTLEHQWKNTLGTLHQTTALISVGFTEKQGLDWQAARHWPNSRICCDWIGMFYMHATASIPIKRRIMFWVRNNSRRSNGPCNTEWSNPFLPVLKGYLGQGSKDKKPQTSPSSKTFWAVVHGLTALPLRLFSNTNPWPWMPCFVFHPTDGRENYSGASKPFFGRRKGLPLLLFTGLTSILPSDTGWP
ncbi:MAG: hypothetical protein EAZ62_01570 [Sphingobacteriia bacterium]|nr:MAG: hypothetical protein EAZ62_01570 [Sphingobacteriia bacterium]